MAENDNENEERETAPEEQQPVDGDSAEESGRSQEEEELDRYYDRIPKMLAHITRDNAERHAALDQLLKTFDKINDLQKRMGIDSHLDLPTIFDLAANGGGEGNLDALREANAAFAEENEILASAVETLSFQVKTMRGQAADEIVEAGLVNKDAVKKIKTQVESVKGVIETLEQYTYENVHHTPRSEDDDEDRDADKDGRSYDERLTADILELEKVNLKELDKDTLHTTKVGKILRKFGLGYDEADIYAVRQLLLATLQVNREQNEIIESLRPLHTQLEKIHQMIELVELLENYDIRKEEAYKEAMEQIDMLNLQLEKFQAKYADYTALEKDTDKVRQDLEDLTEKLEKAKVESEALEKKLEEYRKLEAEFQRKENSFNQLAKSKVTHDEEEFEEFDSPEEEIKHLRERIKNNHLLHDALNDEIAKLSARLREASDGLLLQKKDVEIANLRADIQAALEKAEQAENEKAAIEDRIPGWVKEQPVLQEKVRYWRKKSLFKYSALIVATPALTAMAAFGGYLTHTFMTASAANTAVTAAWALGAGVPALVGGMLYGAWQLKNAKVGEKVQKSIRGAFIGAAVGGVMGALITGLSYTGFNAHFNQAAGNDIRQEITATTAAPVKVTPVNTPVRLLR